MQESARGHEKEGAPVRDGPCMSPRFEASIRNRAAAAANDNEPFLAIAPSEGATAMASQAVPPMRILPTIWAAGGGREEGGRLFSDELFLRSRRRLFLIFRRPTSLSLFISDPLRSFLVVSESADQDAHAGGRTGKLAGGQPVDPIQVFPAGEFRSLTQVGLGSGGVLDSCLSFAAHACRQAS